MVAFTSSVFPTIPLSIHLHLNLAIPPPFLFPFAVVPFSESPEWVVLGHDTRRLPIGKVCARQPQLSKPTCGYVFQELLVSPRDVIDAPSELSQPMSGLEYPGQFF